MTNTATKTYRVAVIERALAYYEVEAESPRAAALDWEDGEFRDRDEEALAAEGPAIVRERRPDGTWRTVPRSEWEDDPPAAADAAVEGAGAHSPGEWHMDIATDGAVIYDDHATIARVPIDLAAWPANAALIKAAPRLLAACRMVVDRWERGDLAEAARACDAAIAEAERCPADQPSGGRFVIHSAEEDAYWSNEVGWTGPEEATVFTAAERGRLRLPIAGRWVASRPYSVLLLYPDHVNGDGTETYYTFVEAPDPVAAVAEARRRALASNEWTAEDVDPDGFAPLLVIEGHHRGQPTSHD
jgi:hypothetical protein